MCLGEVMVILAGGLRGGGGRAGGFPLVFNKMKFKKVLILPGGLTPLPCKLICLLFFYTIASRHPVEGHTIASPRQVQSLLALPNHPQRDDKRTLRLDGCSTIRHNGDARSDMSIVWTSTWNMLGDLPIVFEYLVPGPNTPALFFLESNVVLFSCTGLNNYL